MDFLQAIQRFFDPYDLRARVFPALLAIVPFVVMFVCLYSAAIPVAPTLLTVALACGVPFALSRLVRNAGKAAEAQLFEKWGGMPTTQLLRHRDRHFDQHTKRS